jgi:hypothetical protein
MELVLKKEVMKEMESKRKKPLDIRKIVQRLTCIFYQSKVNSFILMM